MSYQVLARKWRPRTFREMVGQEHVLQALINALDHDRLHHAYLFTGTRGVGKTTIGRILAKCLNCELGVSSAPCNECSSCVEINEGRFVDLIEVDAASRTKVEDTRELLENVQYAPTRGRYKVYLIDEVHMLSNSSFNALLKTLEEPPPHVKFLLATTDPQKLPVTILSRCLQFNLKNMNPERIVSHLQFVLDKEMVPFEEKALWQLARSADGSMRDALSLTDQSIAFGDGKITDIDVRTMLGTIDQSVVYNILQALLAEDAKLLISAVSALAEHAPDYSAALAELIAVFHRIAIAQALPEAVDNSQGDRQQIYEFAQAISAEDIQLYYQTALLGRRDLPLVPDPRSGFEMVLLRMLAFKPQGVAHLPTKTLSASSVDKVVPESPVVSDDSVKPEPAVVNAGEPHYENILNADDEATDTEKKSDTAASTAEQTTENEYSSTSDQHNLESEPNASIEQIHTGYIESATPMSDMDVMADNISQPLAEASVVDVDLPTETSEPPVAPMSVAEILSAAPELASAPVDNLHTDDKELVGESLDATNNSGPKVTLAEFTAEHWLSVYLAINPGGLLQSTAANCQLVELQGQQLHFILDEQQSTLYDVSHQQRLAELLSDYFAEQVQVTINVGQVELETPAKIIVRRQQERQRQAEVAIAQDPLVQQLQSTFSAVVADDSIEPIDE